MKLRLTIILLFLLIPLAQGAGESMALGTFNINMDSAVEVPVLIGNATDVAGGKVTIEYNPSIVTVDDVLPGDIIGTFNKDVNNSKGIVIISTASPTAIDKNKAILAIIRFRGIGVGESVLTIKNEYYFNDIRGNLHTPTISNGLITINATPSSSLSESGSLLSSQTNTTMVVESASESTYEPVFEQDGIRNTTSKESADAVDTVQSSEVEVLSPDSKQTPGFEISLLSLIWFMIARRFGKLSNM